MAHLAGIGLIILGILGIAFLPTLWGLILLGAGGGLMYVAGQSG